MPQRPPRTHTAPNKVNKEFGKQLARHMKRVADEISTLSAEINALSAQLSEKHLQHVDLLIQHTFLDYLDDDGSARLRIPEDDQTPPLHGEPQGGK